MSTWPPPDTLVFQVYAVGTRPVLFQQRRPGGFAEICLGKGMAKTNADGIKHKAWSISTQVVPFDDLYATQEDALAEFRRRPRNRKAA